MDAAATATTVEISALIPVLISIAALFVSVYTFRWTRDTKRKKLIDAVYHDVVRAKNSMERWEEQFHKLPDKMRAEPEYTPYFVVPREDSLAYADIIELMRWLNREEEEIILRYFHAQAALHATAASFCTETVRNLPIEQKTGLADSLVQFCDETLKYANATEKFLAKKKNGL